MCPPPPDCLILDGGLATELEAKGFELSRPLWSARLLLENPEAIETVHEAYLEAGADILTTASYQVSFAGFERIGLGEKRTEEALSLSVRLAENARARFLQKTNHLRPPEIAASLGPYAAFLADGSEYRGNYDVDEGVLVDFHEPQVDYFLKTKIDWIAFETIPCLQEAHALLRILHARPNRREKPKIWISFTCRNGSELASGEKIEEVGKMLRHEPSVFAVGVNCTHPQYVSTLLSELQRSCLKPLIAYPNSGERWNPNQRRWEGERDPQAFAHLAEDWISNGAKIVGGCCRTTPATIRTIRATLMKPQG